MSPLMTVALALVGFRMLRLPEGHAPAPADPPWATVGHV